MTTYTAVPCGINVGVHNRLKMDDRTSHSELDKNALADSPFADAGEVLSIEATQRNWTVVTAVRGPVSS
ncbi:hypothetical protein [Natrialba sp. PRR66]|uniref:hypothetical protein n=1 Tax=Natrialba sp. PRR66 TaxID=3098146 RepID=UPI002B1D33A0|nr:hypothetical protein [Natrialba sp. PRR66]